jgi:hypothetical protein
MAPFELLDYILSHGGRALPFKADKVLAQTPLHYAFKSGNLETALWIMQLVRKEQGYEAYSELLNAMDSVRFKYFCFLP